MKKNYGRYTANAVAVLKASAKRDRLFCNVVPDLDSGILVCNGHYIFGMDEFEYNMIARPVFQRDPGNFVLEDGNVTESDTSFIPKTHKRMIEDTSKTVKMYQSPFTTQDPGAPRFCYWYTSQSDFVAAYNADYMSVFAAGAEVYARSYKEPALIYSGDDAYSPFAAVLPVNLLNDDITRAVKAFFAIDPAAHRSARIFDLQKENEELKSRCAAAEDLFKDLQTEHETLKAAYEELKANKPVITLETPAADPAAEADAEDAGADRKDPETLEDLTSIDGVELIVNGKQTDSPVSWIYGAEKYQELLHKLGFKWSAKKSGYWKKGIAA